MSTRLINGEIFGPGLQVDLGTLDSLYVGRNGVIVSSETTAVQATGSGQQIRVEGTVFGAAFGIGIGSDATASNAARIVISQTGVVSGEIAIHIVGRNNSVSNHGMIDGAVVLNAEGPGLSALNNFGTITFHIFGIVRFGSEDFDLFNAGVIDAGPTAYSSGATGCIDRITNRGLIVGDIVVGGQNDLYDGRGGEVIGGVYGADGLDTFRPGSALDTFHGGAGTDLLDFRDTAGIRVYLDGSGVNTLTAQGDTYVGIERVNGSLVGSDILVGDAEGNILRGYGGIDTLAGGAGADVLIGGAGADRTTGGTGNDVFQFHVIADGGDVITDFANAVGNNDSFRFVTSMGGGLVAGALLASQFQSRADYLAQDANDRSIFRTTDQTLWFDSNGNGVGGLVMMADLQPGAVVTSADILIV